MDDLPKKLAQIVLGLRPRGGAGGQVCTDYSCAICEKTFAHANTAVPLFCPSCERDVRALANRTSSAEDWREAFLSASLSHHTVHLHKLSATTYPADLKSAEMPEEIRNSITSRNIGRLWRARVGRQRRWHYGWEALEAVKKALGGGGFTRPAPESLEQELQELERADSSVGAAARHLDAVKHEIIAKGRKP